MMDDKNTPEDSTDDIFSLIANNCVLVEGGITTLLNGSLLIEPTEGGGFRVTLNNFFTRETDAPGRREESQTNGTIAPSARRKTISPSFPMMKSAPSREECSSRMEQTRRR